jgi:flavorubredoxin
LVAAEGGTTMNTTLCEGIDWVGYVDWTVRDFHSYDTQHGSTYNAYLVRDQKTALIDTVKAPYAGQLLRSIAACCEPSRVDYVVCNHAEPDHSGALPQVLPSLPNATLLCNKKCAAALGQYYDTSRWRIRLVASGDTVPLGKRTLRFLETPMVHWPESMFTYLPEEKLLFSMDAFGQHYASSQRFDDEAPPGPVMDEAKAYYANIIMPYGKAVTACLEATAAWQPAMIAPSHGVIWRRHAAEIVQAYRDWVAGRPRPKVLVIYDTMWESTAAMAEAILEGASQPGVQTVLIHVRRWSPVRIAAEVLDAAAVALGSPTLNREMMPALAAMLCYLKGLRPPGKAGFAFGSYGWGRGGAEAIHQWLAEMQWEILREPLRSQYRPTPAILHECRAAGKMVADKARALATAESCG